MTPAGRPFLLSRLILDAAMRAPDDASVVADGAHLSFASVADRVCRLGSALRAAGIGPNDRIAIFAPKSADTFIAMHAAMHAGGIAVPVNPQSPTPVVEQLVREVEPAAVVLHPATRSRWPERAAGIVSVGAELGERHLDETAIATTDPDGPTRRLADDPAYIITTSGSTGRPKGIVHTHGSGLRYAELAAECYGLTPDDRMANVAPFHFDQSTFELYAAPLVGAAAVLLPEIVLRFPASVAELVDRERVTTWYSVPTILRQLLERGALETRDLSRLRWVLCGGEVFPPSQLRRLMALLPGARFSNVYGPAEVNQCTFHHLDHPPADEEIVPIGRAWDDTEVRIVDGDVEIRGPGRGELLVRSATAMAGYWGRPELTAESFVHERTAGGLERRWYRTGDLVERGTDGLLRFLGRIDRQVKVRGMRIELEAVESAMTAIDGVTASAAIVVPGDGEVDDQLVGVVESAAMDGGSLRRSLTGVLPAGTVPDRFVVVADLPRTGSGKVDANAAAALIEDVSP